MPRPSGVSRTTEPSSGTETSSVPSGAQAASRADGTRANTDIVHPGGTCACRAVPSGESSIPSGTVTDTGTRPAGAAADGAPPAAVDPGTPASVPQPATSAAAVNIRRGRRNLMRALRVESRGRCCSDGADAEQGLDRGAPLSWYRTNLQRATTPVRRAGSDLQLPSSGAQGGDDAAVDEQVGAGDEAGLRSEEEGGGGGDLVGGADPAGGET